MEYKIDITTCVYILVIMLMFFCGTVFGQTFATNETFKDNIAKDITVIEFWADWNKANQFGGLEKLKDCTVYRACIAKCSDAANEYGIKAVPTVIIYDNGKEVKRFTPNIMLQLKASKSDVQSTIDEIVFNKFQ